MSDSRRVCRIPTPQHRGKETAAKRIARACRIDHPIHWMCRDKRLPLRHVDDTADTPLLDHHRLWPKRPDQRRGLGWIVYAADQPGFFRVRKNEVQIGKDGAKLVAGLP